jgi:hypothetical protein
LPVRVLEVERGQLDHVVLTREDASETRLEVAPPHRAQEPDAAEVHPDHGNAGPEEARKGSQDGAVATENDRQVSRGSVRARAHSVLLRLSVREEQLNSVILSDGLQPCEPGSDLTGRAVRHDGRPLDCLTHWLPYPRASLPNGFGNEAV